MNDGFVNVKILAMGQKYNFERTFYYKRICLFGVV
jgi:hypothetical protein